MRLQTPVFWFALAGLIRAQPAPTSYTLENLTVEGNRAYTAAQILAVAGLRVGQKAGHGEFDAARERLEATGAFDKVSYRFAPSQDGEGYDATYEVSEVAQIYSVRFQDLPATDAQLRTWLKQKDPLNPLNLFNITWKQGGLT